MSKRSRVFAIFDIIEALTYCEWWLGIARSTPARPPTGTHELATAQGAASVKNPNSLHYKI